MTAAAAGTAAAADRAVARGTALAAPTQAPERPVARPPKGRRKNVRSRSFASAYQPHYSAADRHAWLESAQKVVSRWIGQARLDSTSRLGLTLQSARYAAISSGENGAVDGD